MVFDVAVVGSANLDLMATTARLPRPGETVLGGSYAEHPGGKGLNQAVAAARAGAAVAFVGAVGDDEAGRRLRVVLDDEGVDTTRLVPVEGAVTGRALIIVDDLGENSIVVVPGANARLSDPRLPPSRVVLVQLEIPLPAVVAALTAGREAGATTVLNPAPAAPLPDDLLALVDILVPNEHEHDVVLARASRRPPTVLTTAGAAGVRAETTDGSWRQPPFAVQAVDTTGAGDAFCGALAATLAGGAALRDAVASAAAAGALATTVAGAVPSLPTAAQIAALLGGPGLTSRAGRRGDQLLQPP